MDGNHFLRVVPSGFRKITAFYDDGNYLVEIDWELGYPKPNNVRVQAQAWSDGIGAAELRGLPMGHALKTMSPIIEDMIQEAISTGRRPLNYRVTTEEDRQAYIMTYVDACKLGSREPLKLMSRLTGQTTSAWGQRMTRYRHEGYLVGYGRDARFVGIRQKAKAARSEKSPE